MSREVSDHDANTMHMKMAASVTLAHEGGIAVGCISMATHPLSNAQHGGDFVFTRIC